MKTYNVVVSQNDKEVRKTVQASSIAAIASKYGDSLVKVEPHEVIAAVDSKSVIKSVSKISTLLTKVASKIEDAMIYDQLYEDLENYADEILEDNRTPKQIDKLLPLVQNLASVADVYVKASSDLYKAANKLLKS